MKRMIAFIASLAFALSAAATTFSPIQLLNPAGSTSGQAIVSTGSSSAPAWGSPNAATLNGATFASPPSTGYGSATPEPVYATTINATGAVTGVGFTSLLSGYLPLTGGTLTGTLTPSQTAGIVGTTTNNNANVGSVGESPTASCSTPSLTANTPVNVCSVSLTAGDWWVCANAEFIPAGTTTVTQVVAGLNTTSATLPANVELWNLQASLTAGAQQAGAVPCQREKLAGSATVYLVVQSAFGTSTMTATGNILANRPR
ncbi:hypothetical protein [Paraburkholderia phenazinium]|uniref:Uncharacterized protein n=1 Tax=Paraburkholderia phenazinium TaxID=60549 RepID=A0A1G8FK71_9BURK|nr:hypothetical protein [Paraburkholderia phenazinium]SDH82416.1 hypothetical protein SAMN05216466_113217 [Paraburkholderia phenazinium]